MQLDISLLNKYLSDLDDFRYKNAKKRIHTETIKEIDPEGEQGESGLSFEIYPFPESQIADLYVKLRITTDSYGDNESVCGIEFVKPKEKLIQYFEKI